MPDLKISQLSELSTVAIDDRLPIVDISDTTIGVSGTTKYITTANFLASNVNPWNSFTIFIPYNNPSLFWEQSITATGITINDAIIICNDAYAQNMDNELDCLNLVSAFALTSTDNLLLKLQFQSPTTGNVQLKWRKL